MTKPIVHFKLSEFIKEGLKVGAPAVIFPIDHPSKWVTNTKVATTSKVIAIGENGLEFETRNTKYIGVDE